MPGSSLRLCAPAERQPKADEALLWAHSILSKIPESTTTSVSARESRFAAILTSDGNLAVVQIGDHDENKARLRWQVEDPTPPGYGPVQVVTLTCLDPEMPSAQPCAIDFDTGQTSVIPAQVLNVAKEKRVEYSFVYSACFAVEKNDGELRTISKLPIHRGSIASSWGWRAGGG